MAIRHPGEKWEYTSNIMMWHDALIEKNDENTRKRLRFIYRRFWTLRSPWALLRIVRMYVSGHYNKYYMDTSAVFWWDVRTVFLRMWNKLRSLKTLSIISKRMI